MRLLWELERLLLVPSLVAARSAARAPTAPADGDDSDEYVPQGPPSSRAARCTGVRLAGPVARAGALAGALLAVARRAGVAFEALALARLAVAHAADRKSVV